MEKLIQYLDDLEDLIYAAPLIAEQVRRAVHRMLLVIASIGLQIGGVVLALYHPPLGMAVVALLVVGLLMRAVVVPLPRTISAG